MKLHLLSLLGLSLWANAEPPFSVRSSRMTKYVDGHPEFENPVSKEARAKAVQDLLGIIHWTVQLNPEPAGARAFAVRLETSGADGEVTILKEIVMKSGPAPSFLGLSVLPADNQARVKLYTTREESLHEIASPSKVRSERGDPAAGVLVRYVAGEKEIFRITWTQLAEGADSNPPPVPDSPESKSK